MVVLLSQVLVMCITKIFNSFLKPRMHKNSVIIILEMKAEVAQEKQGMDYMNHSCNK